MGVCQGLFSVVTHEYFGDYFSLSLSPAPAPAPPPPSPLPLPVPHPLPSPSPSPSLIYTSRSLGCVCYVVAIAAGTLSSDLCSNWLTESMMTSSSANIFSVTCPLYGKFTGHRRSSVNSTHKGQWRGALMFMWRFGFLYVLNYCHLVTILCMVTCECKPAVSA